ncbi:hypothetical protein DM860_000809 [Cuscuta australis]|uniref:PHD-type domain-containing protein n=1 Tax=Cuscuta australis TaxID=267555 RepID=A0A328CXF3_9ASTE|nr:hypothetical protein DM860_000809 [Cuscuta australis]
MLFPKEFVGLCDDGFEGSTSDHHIFREVFFGTDESKKRCLITGAINFECETQNPALMVHASAHGTLADFGGGGQERKVPSSSRSCIERGLNPADASILTFHVVESTNQGITSCSYLQKGQSELDRGRQMCESDAVKLNSCCLDADDGKDGCKIPSPTSQESSVTKLASNSPLAAAKDTRDVQTAKSKKNGSYFVELDESELSVVKDAPNDPRPILRYHINRLLKAAGWVIGRRRRTGKYNGIGEYVYRSPEGKLIREFRRAWLFCGESLITDENRAIHGGEHKVWADMDQFRSDLSSTVSVIEDKLIVLETTSSLATLWCLLDPFANVVFIDKTLHLLKEGITVIPNRTLPRYVEAVQDQLDERSVDDHCIHKECCTAESCLNLEQSHTEEGGCGNSSVSDMRLMNLPPQTFNEPPHKYRKVSCSETGILDQSPFPSYGSDITSELAGSCLFEVPVSLENMPTLFSNQDCSTSSLVYHEKEVHAFDVKFLNQPNSILQESLAFVSNHVLMDMTCVEARTEGISCATNSSSRKKAQKKSRKISEMKPSKLYQRERLVSITNDSCEIKEKGIYNKVRLMKCNKFHPEDDDLLVSAIIKTKTFKYARKRRSGKSKPLRKMKSHKGRCKLLLRSLNKGGKHFLDGKWSAFSSRTVLCWLVHSRAVPLNEVIQYRSLKDGSVLKDGFITSDGILCKCCNEVLSLLSFKNHAGFKLNQPCLNLFLESGKPLTLCQLEAWSAEYKAKKALPITVHTDEMDPNDDSCGRCGDGGELICCDNCPSTFHQACLYAQELPEGSWYCFHCTCQICGDVVRENEESCSTTLGPLTCVQCEHKYHKACLKEQGIEGGETPVTWFCSESCQEVYSGLQSHMGYANLLSDDLYWTLLRCTPNEQKVCSAQRFVALRADCNSKLAVALTIMEECFLPMVDPRTGIDMIPQVIYNWGSQFPRLNYYGFYTMVLEKDDVLISVASIRIHGTRVAEMPLIATCSKYRRQGMCRRLMNSLEEMLKSLKVEKLVISAIPSLVETWTLGFGFEPLEDSEKRSLRDVNLMVFPGTVWLKKTLYVNTSPSREVGPTDPRSSYENDHNTPTNQNPAKEPTFENDHTPPNNKNPSDELINKRIFPPRNDSSSSLTLSEAVVVCTAKAADHEE